MWRHGYRLSVFPEEDRKKVQTNLKSSKLRSHMKNAKKKHKKTFGQHNKAQCERSVGLMATGASRPPSTLQYLTLFSHRFQHGI